jgi:hypothetical protein
MAIDLEAIKRKIAQLEGKGGGGGGNGGSKFKKKIWFKPKGGNEYQIRILPFDGTDGQPFKEIWQYQNIGEHFTLPTLRQYKERDPFAELIDHLRQEGTEKSLELAKALYPKMRAFAAIIVRGEEDKGPQVWGFGKTVYQQILEKMLDSDYGDVSDIKNGFDLKLKAKQIAGKSAPDYTLTAYPTDKQAKPSPLSTDEAKIQAWTVTDFPDLNNLFKKRDYDEMKTILDGWLSGSGEKSEAKTATGSVGTEKTASKIKAPAKAATSAVAVEASLTDAFNDLVGDDD